MGGDLTVEGGSIEAVFRDDYAQLCRLAWLLVGDRAKAEDLVMEAFARAWKTQDRVRSAEATHAYVRTTVVNTCRDHLKRRRTEWRVNALHASRSATDPALPERDDAVLRAVRSLPLRQRTVVVLTYFADLPESAVAAELGISLGTVKSQLSKARRALATVLEETS